MSNMQNRYYKVNDGWFDYFVNADTGEKKFKLDPSDVCVERKLDDFSWAAQSKHTPLDSVIHHCEKIYNDSTAALGRDPSPRNADKNER